MDVYTWIWLAIGAAFAATEVTAIASKDWPGTFSENIQRLFRTNKPKGKLTFALVWMGFSVWFLGHITKMWP